MPRSPTHLALMYENLFAPYALNKAKILPIVIPKYPTFFLFSNYRFFRNLPFSQFPTFGLHELT